MNNQNNVLKQFNMCMKKWNHMIKQNIINVLNSFDDSKNFKNCKNINNNDNNIQKYKQFE